MSLSPPNHRTEFSRLASSHHDSQHLLPKTSTKPQQSDPQDKMYAVTPRGLRSQLLVHNLKASGILPGNQADDAGRPEQLRQSARLLELIGFDENASMYSSYKGEGERRGWRDDGAGKEKKEGGKRSFLKKLVGKWEEKGEKL